MGFWQMHESAVGIHVGDDVNYNPMSTYRLHGATFVIYLIWTLTLE